MKKLSEIGRSGKYKELLDIDTVVIKVEFYFTPKERRELVREAIERWNKLCFGERHASIPSIDEFLESEGL